MKKLNIKTLSYVLVLFFSMAIVWSCEDDNGSIDNSILGPADYSALQALITEVEAFLSTANEGVNAGDHPPGSIADFTQILDDVKASIEKGVNQQLADRAFELLTSEFEAFQVNIVGPANPWIQQVSANNIIISDNVDGSGTEGGVDQAVSQTFTIEGKFWVVNLQQAGFSNVLFGNQLGGVDDGFVVRYFADGHIDVSIGKPGSPPDGGWAEFSTAGGVMPAGRWVHISMVNTGTVQTLYVDGVEAGSQNAEYAPPTDIPLTLGNSYVWSDRTMNGMIRDFRLWSVARTATEISNNVEVDLTGDEDGLEIFFPFDANLGSSFVSTNDKYLATLGTETVWVVDGDLGSVEIDFSGLQAQIAAAQDIIDNAAEGTEDGDYPEGTKARLQAFIDQANALMIDTNSQPDVDQLAEDVEDFILLTQDNLVGPADGVYVDAQDEDAVGMRVTPTFSPTTSFTIEFEAYIESLQSACCAQGNLVGNGSYGLIYGAYDSPDNSEQVLDAGNLYFFIRNEGGYDGARSDARAVNPGTWHHIGLVFENTTPSVARIFVDNEEVASFEGRDLPDAVDWSEMWIGNTWVKSDAMIRDFRFWTEAKDEVTLNEDIDGTEANLEMYFPMDRVKGIFFEDETGNYEAELRGAVWNK